MPSPKQSWCALSGPGSTRFAHRAARVSALRWRSLERRAKESSERPRSVPRFALLRACRCARLSAPFAAHRRFPASDRGLLAASFIFCAQITRGLFLRSLGRCPRRTSSGFHPKRQSGFATEREDCVAFSAPEHPLSICTPGLRQTGRVACAAQANPKPGGNHDRHRKTETCGPVPLHRNRPMVPTRDRWRCSFHGRRKTCCR